MFKNYTMELRFSRLGFAVAATVAFLLSGAGAQGGSIQLQRNTADVSAGVSNTVDGSRADLGGSNVQSYGLPNSTSRFSNISGQVSGSGTFQAGDFTLNASGSADGDLSLHAYSSIVGAVAGNHYLSSDSYADFWAILTVTGPVTPESVVFHLTASGTTGSGLAGGSGWTDPQGFYGDIGLGTYFVDETTGALYDGSASAVVGFNGDGRPLTGDTSVNWNRATSANQLLFYVLAEALARVKTTAEGAAAVSLTSDVHGRLTGVSILDSSGQDVTGLETISFASADSVASPEPGTATMILGVGALLAGWRHLRKSWM